VKGGKCESNYGGGQRIIRPKGVNTEPSETNYFQVLAQRIETE
jgi:hypothetical protein